MAKIHLPEVVCGFEEWTCEPVWLRVARTLHAIVWVYPWGHQQKTHYLTRSGLHHHDGSDDAKAVVLCETPDCVGLVNDMLDEKYRLCPKCARLLDEFPYEFWSKQLADVRLQQMRGDAQKRECHTIDWALSQVDTSSYDKCCEMLDEIASRAPNYGAGLFGKGLLLGVPDVGDTMTDEQVRRIMDTVTATTKRVVESSTATTEAHQGLRLVKG